MGIDGRADISEFIGIFFNISYLMHQELISVEYIAWLNTMYKPNKMFINVFNGRTNKL
jgi:hypothetical protein